MKILILNQTIANRINSSYGADHFDSTPDRFDNLNIAEYLNGSGQAGGPLATINNTDFRSDFRIFNSDGNTTIIAMNTPQTFEDTRFNVFERMINTVPKEVQLSTKAVGPRLWITIETHLDLSPNGEVLYSGTVVTHSRNGSTDQASYYYGTAGGGKTNPKLTSVGCVYIFRVLRDLLTSTLVVPPDTFSNITSRPFGIVTWYNFTNTFNSTDIASINIQDSYTEAIDLNLFVIPSQSFVNNINFSTPQYLVRAAVRLIKTHRQNKANLD